MGLCVGTHTRSHAALDTLRAYSLFNSAISFSRVSLTRIFCCRVSSLRSTHHAVWNIYLDCLFQELSVLILVSFNLSILSIGEIPSPVVGVVRLQQSVFDAIVPLIRCLTPHWIHCALRREFTRGQILQRALLQLSVYFYFWLFYFYFWRHVAVKLNVCVQMVFVFLFFFRGFVS